MNPRIPILLLFLSTIGYLNAQPLSRITGKVTAQNNIPVAGAHIQISNTSFHTLTDSLGNFSINKIPYGNYQLMVIALGFRNAQRSIQIKGDTLTIPTITLIPAPALDEVVVTGTLKEVRKTESPVSVEVYTPAYFRKNPTPNIFDALQNVNGVRPQLNCNICNTGDIHINGLEGPYTMVLIDGMPIVSSLSTVYGLAGIPNALVERIEIVKGPASSLYGSEAVGGLINIITKKPANAPLLAVDVMATSWKELTTDLGFTFNVGKKAMALTGIHHHNYSNPIDNNHDGFTDVTLQNRTSLFQKWNFTRKDNRLFTAAARYYYEDRWGGQTNWNKNFRGGDSIYGESIYTNRLELLANYQLPVKEKILFNFSLTHHDQDSRYGTTSYIAQQSIAFQQLTWDKKINEHDLLAGAALRYTFYDDNTPVTQNTDPVYPANLPQKVWLPGIFLQDEIGLATSHKLLLGFRYDHHSVHGHIVTPRIAYKWSLNEKNILRINAGTGYRVVNLFTEEHAALTGAREVVIQNELRPEKTYNVNVNLTKKMFLSNGSIANFDITGWYTYFTNRITGDFDTDPNKIIYDNLAGHAISKGLSLSADIKLMNGLKLNAGFTYQDVALYTQKGLSTKSEKTNQVLTEKYSGTWAISYKIPKTKLAIDYTGNIYGPMRLPLLSTLDPRKANSPVWSIQNIQLVYAASKRFEWYGGVKNLLNWTPNKGNPFIIARAHDPFDKKVVYAPDGAVMATPENPYALSFDPTYVYAPNQGIRIFMGLRYTLH